MERRPPPRPPTGARVISEVKKLERDLQGLSRLGAWRLALVQFRKIQAVKYEEPVRADLYTVLVDAFRRDGPGDMAESMLEEMEEIGVSATAETYHALGKVLAARRDWQAALELWEKTQKSGIEPRAEMYGTIISSCRGHGDIAKKRATEIFASMGRDFVRPTPAVYNALAETLNNPEKAFHMLSQMSAMGVQPNERTYAVVAMILAGHNRKVEIEKVITQMEEENVQPSPIFFENIIRGYRDSKSWEDIVDIWHRASTFNVSLAEIASSHTKRTMLQASLRTKSWQEGLRVLKSLDEPPKLSMSIAMVTTLSSVGKCVEALRLLRILSPIRNEDDSISILHVENEEKTPNSWENLGRRGLNSILAATVRERNWEFALQTIKSAKSLALKPDQLSYNSAIAACARSSRYREGKQLLEDMLQERSKISNQGAASVNLDPDAMSYNPLVYAAENVDEAESMFNDMQSHGIMPDHVTYVSLISAAARIGNVTAARNYFDKLRSWSESNANESPSVFAYNSLANAYVNAGDWRGSLELLEEMRQQSVLPDVRTYTAACASCFQDRSWEVALSLLSDMKQHTVEPSVKTYQTVLKVINAAGQWKHCMRIYSELRDQDVIPSALIYSHIIEAACRLGDVNQALRIHRTMLRAQKAPTQRATSLLLSNLLRNNMTMDVVEVMEGAIDRGQSGPPAAYKKLLRHIRKQTEMENRDQDLSIAPLLYQRNVGSAGVASGIQSLDAEETVVISRIEVPPYVPRADFLDQLVRWAVIEVDQSFPHGVAKVAPLHKNTGEYRGFELQVGQNIVDCVIDDEKVGNIRTLSTRTMGNVGSTVASAPAGAMVSGKHFEIRRRASEPLAAEAKPVVRRFLKSLSLAITNYIAFGTVFADH